jgi:BASS family bile acid:Na+ symporter
MKRARTLLLALSPIALLVAVIGFTVGNHVVGQAALTTAAVSFAIGLGGSESFAGYQFTAWIIAAVTVAMCYPERFLHIGPMDLSIAQIPAIDLRNKWLVLIIVQLVMFGMGTKMRLDDFVGVAKMPYPVFIGTFLQFLIMPLLGYGLTKVFSFPPEIAAGLILVGACSSGLSSNVMSYLAGADLALSVTLTAVGTLMSPFITPLWIYALAGESVPSDADFVGMMLEIVRLVLLPIGAALLHDILNRSSATVCNVVYGTAVLSLAYLFFGDWTIKTEAMPLVVNLAGGVVLGVAFHLTARRLPVVEEKIHIVSMFGIIYFTAVTTAAGRDNLLNVGLGLKRKQALTVAFEVAMQNGSMASGLANWMGKLGTVGLAAAVFSPWMNVSGSVIANLIRRYAPIDPEEAKTETT